MTDGTGTSGDGLFSRDLAPPPLSPWWRRALVLGIIGGVCVVVWMWVHGSTEGAVRAISRAQQEAFYEAWADQRTHCLGGEGSPEPASRCRQRAEFILLFPPCDDACRAELAPSLQGAPP